MFLIPILATAIAMQGPAQAAQSVQPVTAPAGAKPAAIAEADPTVCRNERGTGTQFSHKVCMKKSEWAHMAESARQMGSKVQGATSAIVPN
jgi:hypothetical protein